MRNNAELRDFIRREVFNGTMNNWKRGVIREMFKCSYDTIRAEIKKAEEIKDWIDKQSSR
jgi:hypothetical protein